MLYNGVSLVPVFVIVVLLDFLFLEFMFLHHELTVTADMNSDPPRTPECGGLLFFFFYSGEMIPVRILDDAPVDPFLQDFKVRDAGCFGEV